MEFRKFAKGASLAAGVLLLLVSPALYALGLGSAHVRSYLGQPLDVRIDLISRTEAELASVGAGLASADDFRMIGLDRGALAVPLAFQVNRDFADPHIRVSSSLPVNDPVVQVVIEVTFSSGRMLREYTLFLDPPTLPAPVPMPSITPRAQVTEAPDPVADAPVSTPPPAPAEVEREVPEPFVEPSETRAPAISERPPEAPAPREIDVEPQRPEPSETTIEQPPPVADEEMAPAIEPEAAEPEPEPAETIEPLAIDEEPVIADSIEEAADDEPVELPTETSVQDTEADMAESADPELVPEPTEDLAVQAAADEEEIAAEQTAEEAEVAVRPEATAARPSEPTVYQAPAGAAGEYGPVQSGETMWAIASGFARGSGYSINQTMLAIQRQNPEAFNGNNINSLKRGAILRMPTSDQIAAMSAREAMLEAIRQEEQYRARVAGRPYDDSPPPMVADLAPADDTDTAPDIPSESADVEQAGRLELVPPSESGSGELGQRGVEGSAETQGMSAEAQLARAQEELANAEQENEYLSERIRELEAQIAAAQAQGTVRDSGLAELESRLREDRLSGEPEAPVAAVRPSSEPAWYEGKAWWITGLAVVLLAAVVWFLRRLGSAAREPLESQAETVSTIKGEAEEVLRVLDGEAEAQDEGDNVIDLERYVEPGQAERAPDEPGEDGDRAPETEPEPEPDHESGVDAGERGSPGEAPDDEGDADGGVIELDADDPETKLDLARAYISMGDKDAARALLEEVITGGNDDQAEEARRMMTEL